MGRRKGHSLGNRQALVMFRITQDMVKSILLSMHSRQGDAGRIIREGIISVRELDSCNFSVIFLTGILFPFVFKLTDRN